MIREVLFEPDLTRGLEMRLIVRGEKGAVHFYMNTGFRAVTSQSNEPFVIDLGYHSYTRVDDNCTYMGPCKYLDGHDCYYAGSTLAANDLYRIICEEGSEEFWKMLELFYNETFGSDEHSDQHYERTEVIPEHREEGYNRFVAICNARKKQEEVQSKDATDTWT
jgi:hypothetical protein